MPERSRERKSLVTHARRPPREQRRGQRHDRSNRQGTNRSDGLAAWTAARGSADRETCLRQTADWLRAAASLFLCDNQTGQWRCAELATSLDSRCAAPRWRHRRLLQPAHRIFGILPGGHRLYYSNVVRFCAGAWRRPSGCCRGTGHRVVAFPTNANRRVFGWIAGQRSAAFGLQHRANPARIGPCSHGDKSCGDPGSGSSSR